MTLLRDGKEVTVTAKVGELPDDQQVASADSKAAKPDETTKPTAISGLGLSLAPITPDAKDNISSAPDQKGVVVTDVAPDGTAADRGLKPGDVIVEVQQEPVSIPPTSEPRRQCAQAEPQVGADADPAPGQPAMGAGAAGVGRQERKPGVRWMSLVSDQ